MGNFKVEGNIINITKRNIFFGEVAVEGGKIKSISKISEQKEGAHFISPGFIDSHVHIESSMLIPSEFARLAVVHGTVSTISDPHEIANVCGMEGVEFMIENGNTVPFKFNFGAPSCVPATIFETAGAELDHDDVKSLLERPEIKYLSEMMNFPGVLYKDEEVLKKISAAHHLGKPVDGHAPGLRGDAVQQYINAGISTDHECFTAEEALDKLQRGMKILIREGSAAKNFEALIDLLNDWPEMMMFCSDDKHPDSLVENHINQLCARAVEKGINIFNILRAACINPILHYKLDVGSLQINDDADFIVLEDLKTFKVKQTYIDGILLAENGKIVGNWVKHVEDRESVNHFDCSLKKEEDFIYPFTGQKEIPVIEALDGQLITNRISAKPKVLNQNIISDPENDVLKMVVVNRYHDAPIAISFVKNFGLKEGAIASSVAHDSHNIIAVGVDDKSICEAVNLVINETGGVVALGNGEKEVLALPVAGLMSNHNGYQVAESYTSIDQFAKDLGSTLLAPFMTLSFMALLVIPHLKLSDKGLFDGDEFKFV
ncbi:MULTISPECIES: adenine deaminase [unclassified Pedobacter]|uniref:adenine deaminase n=1 Tax=unclassified Pedobacter TaxID=2628915 RepID=UPI001DC46012|nr:MULTISPECIES: adenine deaminase [unclassified Pedobacter]CAH0233615.1 Adenine deaminase [Pedobacter sp. Bi36]CAH0260394.1 Adenine deaminase [Pedobacter sp. Bi126]